MMLRIAVVVLLASLALRAQAPVSALFAWDVDPGVGLEAVGAQLERDGSVAACGSFAAPTPSTRQCRATVASGQATFRVRMVTASGIVGPWSDPVVAAVGTGTAAGQFTVTWHSPIGVAPAMAFPTTGILDNFNRANEGPPPSASWTADPLNVGVQAHAVFSSFIINGQHTYWSAAPFGPDLEAYFTIGAINSLVGFHLRIQSPNTAGADAYEVAWRVSGLIEVIRVIDSYTGETAIDSVTVAAAATGHKFGVEVLGTGATVTINCYVDTGSGWTLALSAVDTGGTRITGAGYIGVFTGHFSDIIDDFGGGSVVGGATGATPLVHGGSVAGHRRHRLVG